jgi:integrase/recombinase XerD
VNTKTLHDLLDEFLGHAEALKHSHHTRHSYRVNLRRFLRWLEEIYSVRTADRLHKKHLFAWLKHLSEIRTHRGLPLRPTSLNKNIENTRQFIGYLERLAYLPRGMADMLEYVKEPDLLPTSVLTHAQVKKLINRVRTDSPAGYRDRAMLELLYSTGIRVNELLTLQMPNVDLQNATAIVNGKGEKQRVVPIGRTALRYLRTYLVAVRPYLIRDREQQAVFLSTVDSKPVHYQTFRKILRGYAATANLPVNVTPHTFRRSCTTEMLRGGANMYHVKELLGHESLNTLRHYAKLTITDLKKTHAKCHPREREEDR